MLKSAQQRETWDSGEGLFASRFGKLEPPKTLKELTSLVENIDSA